MTFILAVNPKDEAVRFGDAGAARAVIMAEVARLVEEGDATIVTFESGTVEMRLMTGAIFHLGTNSVTRIA
jgi:hypothetical protein